MVFIPNAFNIDLVEEYDPSTDQWQVRAPMPTPRSATAWGVYGGCIYVAGGAIRHRDIWGTYTAVDVIYGIIEQRCTAPSAHNDLLDMLLKARDDTSGEKMTDRQLRDEVITIFSVGHETTANLLSWTLYLMARHPDVLAKLRQELDGSLQGKIPSAKILQQLVYTRAVLNESMRFRPPAGILLRKVNKNKCATLLPPQRAP